MEYSNSMEIECQYVHPQRKHFFKSALMMKESIVSGMKTIYKGMFYGTEKCATESNEITQILSTTPLESTCSQNDGKDNEIYEHDENVSNDSSDGVESGQNISNQEGRSQTAQKGRSKENLSNVNQSTMDSSIRSHTSLVREILELSNHRRDTKQTLTNYTAGSVNDSLASGSSEISPWYTNSDLPVSKKSEDQKDCCSDDSNCSFRTAISDLDSFYLCTVSEVNDSPSFNQLPHTESKTQENSWALKRYCNQQENCFTESTCNDRKLNFSQQFLSDSFGKTDGQSIECRETLDISGLNSLNKSLCHLNFSFSEEDFQFCKKKNTAVQSCSTPTLEERKLLLERELSAINRSFKTREMKTNTMEETIVSSKHDNPLTQFGPKKFNTTGSKIKSSGGNLTTEDIMFEEYPNSESATEIPSNVNGKSVLQSTFTSQNSDKKKRKLIDYFPDCTSIDYLGKSNRKRQRLNKDSKILSLNNSKHSESISGQSCEKTLVYEGFTCTNVNVETYHKQLQIQNSIMMETKECNKEPGIKKTSKYCNTINKNPGKTNEVTQLPLHLIESFGFTENQNKFISLNNDTHLLDEKNISIKNSTKGKTNEVGCISDINGVENQPNKSESIPQIFDTFILQRNCNNSMESVNNPSLQQLDFQKQSELEKTHLAEAVSREKLPKSLTEYESKSKAIGKKRNACKRRKMSRTGFVRERRKRKQEWSIEVEGSTFHNESGPNNGFVKPLILFRPPRVFKTKSLKQPSESIKTNQMSETSIEMNQEILPTYSEAVHIDILHGPKESFKTNQKSYKSSLTSITDHVKRVFELLSPRCQSAPPSMPEQSTSCKDSFTSTDEADFKQSMTEKNGTKYRSVPASPYQAMELSKAILNQETGKCECRKEAKDHEVPCSRSLPLSITDSVQHVLGRRAKTKALCRMKEQLSKRKRQRRTINVKESQEK